MLLLKLALRLLAPGDVLHQTQHVERRAVFVAQHVTLLMHPVDAAVRPDHAVLNLIFGPLLQTGPHRCCHPLAVFRVHCLKELRPADPHPARLVAEKGRSAAAPVQLIRAKLPIPATGASKLLALAEPFLAALEGQLRLFAPGHVLPHQHVAEHLANRIADR